MLTRKGIDVLRHELDDSVEGRDLALLEGDLGNVQPLLENQLSKRLALRGFGRAIAHLKAGEVAPMVKDAEDALVLTRAEEVRTETRAAAYHLPELHGRFYRPREN